MKAYCASLTVMLLLAAFVRFLSPGGDYTKKFLRPVIGLLLLLTLLSPLRELISQLGSSLPDKYENESDGSELYAAQAYALFEFLDEKYGVIPERIAFVLGEGGEEIQLFCPDIPDEKKAEITRVLEEEYDCGIKIFRGGENGGQ